MAALITPQESLSPFFRLPRELRNQIYDGLPRSPWRLFPADTDRRAGYTLDSHRPVKAFRLVCRRFTAEYDEQMLSTSRLRVWQAFRQDLRPSCLPLAPATTASSPTIARSPSVVEGASLRLDFFRNLELFIDTDCHGPSRPTEFRDQGYDAETDLLNHRECLEELVARMPSLVRARMVLLVRTVRCDDFGLREYAAWDEPQSASRVHRTVAELVKAGFWAERLDRVAIWHKRNPPQWLSLGRGDELCATWTFKGGWKARGGVFWS